VEIVEAESLISKGDVDQPLTFQPNRACGEKRTPPRTDVKRFSIALPILDDNKRWV
jgi:hypothetical protein